MATQLSPRRAYFIVISKMSGHGRIPSRNTKNLRIQNFRSTASVAKKRPPDPVHTVRTLPNVEAVRQAVIRRPRLSAGKYATALHLPHSGARRVIHKDLNFQSYNMVVVQQLSDPDTENRRTFSEKFLNGLTDDGVILMSDEARFFLSGTVNKQDFRYWAGSNTQYLHQHPLHSPRVTVWCRAASLRIVGFFFKDGGQAVTVTSARCVEKSWNFLARELH